MSYGFFANISSKQSYQNYVKNQADQLFDQEYVFNRKDSNGVSAADMSYGYMSMIQRKKFSMEFYEDADSKKTTMIDFYINPNKLSYSQQKIIGKQITRGGIFYHHYGEDNATLQLSGTTGMSAMAGLKRLEKAFHASGTLLAYKNYMPTQVYGTVDSYEIYDYSDPYEIASSVSSKSTTNVSSLTQKVYEKYKDDINTSDMALGIYLINSVGVSNSIKNAVNKSIMNAVETISNINTDKYTYKQFYKKVKDILEDECNLDEDIIEDLAQDICEVKYYSNYSNSEIINIKKQMHGLSGSSDNSTIDNNITRLQEFSSERQAAVDDFCKKLGQWYKRDIQIRDYLRSGLTSIESILQDKWLPRLITMYFENVAYLGFFEAYDYNRDASSNLINYNMKFTVLKKIEFTNTTNEELLSSGVSTTNSSNNESNSSSSSSTTDVTIVESTSSVRDDYTYIMYRGMTIEQLVRKYYYFPNEEACQSLVRQLYEYNGLENGGLILEGQAIRVPDMSKLVM